MSSRQARKTSSLLPAKGPTPSGPPQWSSTIAVAGKARAMSITSASWVW